MMGARRKATEAGRGASATIVNGGARIAAHGLARGGVGHRVGAGGAHNGSLLETSTVRFPLNAVFARKLRFGIPGSGSAWRGPS